MRRTALLILITLFFTTTAVKPSDAQSRSVLWERWDVIIDNIDTTSNRFDVAEIYDVRFTGTFRFGSAVIPDDRLENITDIRVYEDGRPLQESCSENPGTFCVTNVVEGISIVYYFSDPITDATQNFRIEYTVSGALRIYEDGDQLWWAAIPEDHFGFPIENSTITVQMPEGYGPREGIDPVVTYGAPGVISVQGEQIIATATRQIGGNEAFEIRVQYPHDPNAVPTAWQADFDSQRDYEENIKPLVDIGLIGISLLLAIGGPLGVFAIWYTRGRDPEIGPVPEFLSEPPSDLPPAIAGTLVDERADTRDVLSTLIHLGSRGYLVIEENRSETEVFGLTVNSNSEFIFKRTDKTLDDLREYERKIMQRVFGNSLEKPMAELKDKFYVHMSNLKDDLYDELVDEELFTAKPSTTRSMWSTLALVVLGIAFFLGFMAVGAVDSISGMVLCVPISLGFTGITAAIISNFMPAKTRKGAEEAAKWNAFREWMQNLEKFSKAEDIAPNFDKYLAYAIAFGMERSWVQRFSKIELTPMPTWYFPTYWGGSYSRGYRAGTPIGHIGRGMPSADDVLPGELASASDDFSLENMAGDITGGLESISNGLTEMLESASRTLTSQPQQASSGSSGSWGSGGSSWSGGGFSGGGSSGGGSRGFG